MLQANFASPESGFEEWLRRYQARARVNADMAQALSHENQDISHDLDQSWLELSALEQQMIVTRWPGWQGALVKLRIALTHARQMADGDSDDCLDQNWLLVASAISDLLPPLEGTSIPDLPKGGMAYIQPD